MQQTPLREYFDPDVLKLVPKDAARVIEVGCGGGSLAREYRIQNPRCEYIGIEIVPEYAKAARAHCTDVLVDDIEQMADAVFATLFPSSCWVFADVLEHLYDPWAVLRRVRESLPANASVVACLPNAQHWSVQARLNCGTFRYEDLGLMDRTHIRWFTRTTMTELFESTGFEIVEGGRRIVDEPLREAGLQGVRAMAEAIGADVETAIADATPFQWIVRARPAR